jgi:small subunit ribosomal protein S21
MIIINVKENESIDKALKRFKKKFERTGTLKEIRAKKFLRKAICKESSCKNQSRLQRKNVCQRKLLDKFFF